MKRHLITLAALALPFFTLQAQDANTEAEASSAAPKDPLVFFESMGVKLQHGPLKGALGSHAEMEVPADHFITDGDGCRKILAAFGNLTGSDEVGLFAPKNMKWFITFDFENVGYVKDDEKDKLDADKMLKSIKEGNEKANEYKKGKGMPTFTIIGFEVPPKYNTDNNNLEWAIKLKDDASQEESINFNTKILGRHGVMVVTLVCDPSDLTSLMPSFRERMATFQYLSGNKYAEFKQGDKVAKYGLTALVVGGGVALAAKSGLLGKLLKPILVGVAAVGFWLKNLFSRNKQG
jgi:uncharacterized membrane-anchored protein